MTLNLQDVAQAMGAEGSPPNLSVAGWSVDTRTQNVGDVYFALRGPNHDGHDFVEVAIEKGAAAVVIDRGGTAGKREGVITEPQRQAKPAAPPMQVLDLPGGAGGFAGGPLSFSHLFRGRLLLVADTLRALQDLGAWARGKWGGQVVGVTGSAGKTTTKDAIAHLLESEMPVGKTIGNFNNHVGVPLSIVRLPDSCRVGVLEMGMNHAGEIRDLAAIAKPQVGVVTNVGYAHVEFFDSIGGVAAAKRELIEGLPRDGVAVLNADDPRVLKFRDIHPGRSVTFGLSGAADVKAENVDTSADGTRFRALGVDFETGLTGRHAVSNLLAAIAVARVFDIAPQRLREPVRTFAIGKMRGERLEHRGIVVWNDCYNSNPEAAEAMIDVLRKTAAKRRIAVLGEMLELGHASEELHRRLGRYAAQNGVDALIGVGGNARHMVDEGIAAGLQVGAARFFDLPEGAGDWVREFACPGDAVLFKGSRGVRVERALDRFLGIGG
ncbi:MAG TPA: UDP-N-acetylmuramoyl-tripeptide--D-alanyl-D-alanine ligase [Bryobacteraceae bacterium]|nr:UDP-N-acetylmuramoyl-tripeptide--D-alanyl-D-alanine ligase [Bryobacteraceae bacterium]